MISLTYDGVLLLKMVKWKKYMARLKQFLDSVLILYPLVFSGGIKWEHWPEMG